MRLSQVSLGCLQILQNTNNNCIFANDASVIFHWRKYLLDTRSLTPATTSCKFSMYSLCQALNRRKFNSTIREKQADRLLAVRARGAEVLGAHIVLLFTGDLRLDGHYLRSKWIIVVSLVQLRRVLHVHLENKSFLVLLIFPMIE